MRTLSRRCAVLVVAVVLTGCSAGSPPAGPGAAAPTTAAPVPPPSVVAVPADLAVPEGLVPVTTSTGDPRDARFVTTYDVPGVPAYRDLAAAVVAGAVADQTAGLQAIADEEARHGRLTVTSHVVAAGGQVTGLRIDTLAAVDQGLAAPTTRSSSTAYADRSGGEVVTSPELLTDEGRTALTEAVVATLPVGAPSVASPQAQVTRDLRVQPDGSVVAVVGRAGGLVDPAAGDVAVELPAARVADWLSPAGRRVADELADSAPSPVAPPAGVDCAVQACIALTFDDGPGPYTARLLDELAAAGVPATFFVVGQNVVARPELVARAVAEGHEIGNHSWDHPQLTTLDAAGVADQLARTDAAITAATGGAAPTIVRPPYGDYDDAVLADLAARGGSAVTWDVDTRDWQNRDAGVTTARALDGVASGSVVLMHDIHPSTVDAVPGLVAQLRQRGFTFVTVSQLLGSPLTPGAAYARGPERP